MCPHQIVTSMCHSVTRKIVSKIFDIASVVVIERCFEISPLGGIGVN